MGVDRTFWGLKEPCRGSIERFGGFDRTFWGGRRFQGAVLKPRSFGASSRGL